MKGIVLAGGEGQRLFPLTISVSKQLLPVYDKPMIYYPISILMQAGIRDIAIVTRVEDQPLFQKLLGDGHQIGVSFSYIVQPEPKGIAEAFLLAEDFIDGDTCALILGDNIFYSPTFSKTLKEIKNRTEDLFIFGLPVNNPERYGVMNFGAQGQLIEIEEKPIDPKSNVIVTGLYFYDEQVVSYAKQLTPSGRGELEITDINNRYIDKGKVEVILLEDSFLWLDAGTQEDLQKASETIFRIENRLGKKIACLEELAYRKGWISIEALEMSIERYKQSQYGEYLQAIVMKEGSL